MAEGREGEKIAIERNLCCRYYPSEAHTFERLHRHAHHLDMRELRQFAPKRWPHTEIPSVIARLQLSSMSLRHSELFRGAIRLRFSDRR